MLKLEIRQENQTQSVTDLNDEEKLALFRVGRRRRPTQFQIFTGPGRQIRLLILTANQIVPSE